MTAPRPGAPLPGGGDKSIPASWVVWSSAGSAAAGWLASLAAFRYGWGILSLPVSSLASFGVIALALSLFGWPLLRWSRGRRDRPLNPLAAARTVVMGQASLLIGAALAGWHVGVLAHLLPSWGVRPTHAPYWVALAVVGASVLLALLGWFVERWGRVPPEDPSDLEEAR